MENNYNFNINSNPIDKNKIDKHKDFDALMKRVQVGTSPKLPNRFQFSAQSTFQWITGIAAIFIVGMTIFGILNDTGNNYQQAAKDYFAAQPYISPPLNEVQQKAMTINVNANQGGTYTFPSGSRMVVPKSAFANSYGALIEGEVEVHFKEFHDYVDFFLSGIPMEIKVDGKDQILESAGMIEVYATQNGERLTMVPENPINIELKSKLAFNGETPPDFNIYYLDEEKRSWDIQGKDKIELIANPVGENDQGQTIIYTRDSLGNIVDSVEMWVDTNPEESLSKQFAAELIQLDKKVKQQLAQVENQFPKLAKPKKPERYDGKAMTFEFDYKGNKEGTQLYNGTIWQVLSSVDDYEEITSTVWEEPILEKQANGSFVVKLKKGEKRATLKVKPVLVGNDYDQAILQFESQLAEYQQEKERIAIEIAGKKRQIEERLAVEKELADKSFEEKMAALKAKGQDNYVANEIVKRAVINKFSITRFGTWNCDRPMPPYLAVLKGTFQDQNSDKFENRVVYHSDKSRNTVSRFYLKDFANVQYNEKSENLFWIVTEDSKLAVFYPEYFERIKQKEGAYTFEMDLTTASIDSEADVRKILRL